MPNHTMTNDSNAANIELEKKVRRLLLNWGFVPLLRGSQYIVNCTLRLACAEHLTISSVYDAYDETAFCFYSTSARVEKAIRHAIEISWSLAGERTLRNVFTVQPNNIEFLLFCHTTSTRAD
ncbi:MAG: sporulation initiation factor Spo0A C-terminal domain-containing protein [Bacillota bacterium]